MPSIDGLVSGFDTASIIDGLVQLQQAQVDRLTLKKNAIQVKQQAFSGIEARLLSLRSKMSQLNRSTGGVFSSRLVTSSDESIIVATASSRATEGSYNLRVTSTAKAHQIGSQGFDGTSAAITEGTISFQTGDRPPTEITIDSSNNTLQGLVQAINNQSEDVSASIIHDQAADQDRILLTSRQTGQANAITVVNNLAATNGGATRPDFSGPAIQEATNAAIVLGSGPGAIVAEYDTNQVDGLIEGVTLDLLAVDANKDVTINVQRDNERATQAVQDFVDEYNSLISYINDQTQFNSETNEASPLLGNRSVAELKNQLGAFVTDTIAGATGGLNRLSQIGIQIDNKGKLILNTARLGSVLDGDVEGLDPNDIPRLFGLTGESDNAGIQFILGSTRTEASSTPYQVDILQAAEQAKLTATSDLASSIVIDATNNSFQIKVDGRESESLTLTQGTYTQQELADHLESIINASSELQNRDVSVSLEGSKLAIQSVRYGTASKVSIVGGSALSALGLSGSEVAVGKDVAGSFIVDGQTEVATGRGRVLIGDENNQHTADIQIRVNLDPSQVGSGIEGELSIARGVTSRIDQFLSNFLNPTTGSLGTINDSFDLRIKSIDDSISRVNQISADKREYLIKQFATLERVLSELQTTGSFLTAQLGTTGQ